MAFNTTWTLEEARTHLQAWKDCEYALATGQAKAYRVGTREFTAFDLEEVRKRLEYFSNLVESLSGTVRTSRVTRVVPRDL